MSVADMILAIFLLFFFGGLLVYGFCEWAVKRMKNRRKSRIRQVRTQNKTAPQRQLIRATKEKYPLPL